MRSLRTSGDSLSPHCDVRAAELLQHVDPPQHLAGRRVHRAQVAARAERVELVAFDRRRRPRAVAAVVAEALAVRRFPQPLAGLGVERDHVLGPAARAERIEPAVRVANDE